MSNQLITNTCKKMDTNQIITNTCKKMDTNQIWQMEWGNKGVAEAIFYIIQNKIKINAVDGQELNFHNLYNNFSNWLGNNGHTGCISGYVMFANLCDSLNLKIEPIEETPENWIDEHILKDYVSNGGPLFQSNGREDLLMGAAWPTESFKDRQINIVKHFARFFIRPIDEWYDNCWWGGVCYY